VQGPFYHITTIYPVGELFKKEILVNDLKTVLYWWFQQYVYEDYKKKSNKAYKYVNIDICSTSN